MALPTRSVHRLPSTAPRRARAARRPLGRARAARTLAAYTSLALALAAVAQATGWALRVDRFLFIVSPEVPDALERAAVVLLAAGLVGAALTLVAAGTWLARRLWRALTPGRDRQVIDLR